jgi:putative tryptophan/tyrosine transport system substrate-binding protein
MRYGPQGRVIWNFYIGRRDFIVALGSVAAWPLAARAQKSDRMRRIGVLMGYAESDREGQGNFAALQGGLQTA